MKNVFDFLGARSASSEELYLGLFLKEEEGKVLYIEKQLGSLHIVHQERFTYTNGWDHLIEDVDEALYKLESKTKKSPDQTIFFIYSHLVDNFAKEIKRQYLHKIKELSKSLELKPLGYIECHEAIVESLQKKEQGPLNAVLIEFDKKTLGVFAYKTGKLIFEESLPRGGDLIHSLLPVFEKIKSLSALPSRLILYNSNDLDIESSKLLTHNWGENFFVQLPKIEVVKETELVRSLLDIFMDQITPSKQPQTVKSQEILGFTVGSDSPSPKSFVPVQTLLESLKAKTKQFAHTFSNLTKKTPALSRPIIIAGAVAVLFFLTFSVEYFFHNAEALVMLPSRQISKNIEVQGVKLQTQTQKLVFSEKKNATGQREIGEEAKGEVTVHNFDNKQRTFEKGTVLTAQGKKFVMDADVKVASVSAPKPSEKVAGTAKVKVQAEEIGEEGNLSKNQTFRINDLPEDLYFAVNENSLSGGTKKKIKTVSKEDQSALQKTVMQKAKENNTGGQSKTPQGTVSVSQLTEIEFEKLEYSKEVGEEADEVSLKAQVTTTSKYYTARELQEKLKKLLAKDVPSDFQLQTEKISYNTTGVKLNKNTYTLQGKVSAKAVKEFAAGDLQEKIKGKSLKDAEKITKETYGASDIDIVISHILPFMKSRLPFFKKNIKIETNEL